jgi:leucyl aminopeptidase
MLDYFTQTTDQSVVPVLPLNEQQLSAWLSSQEERVKQWVCSTNFTAEPARVCLIPAEDGQLQCVLLGAKDADDFWVFGDLSSVLPQGVYAIDAEIFTESQYFHACMAWGLGAYRFTHYRQDDKPKAQLLLSTAVDASYLQHWVQAIHHARDWVNMPAGEMTPKYLAKTAESMSERYSAKTRVIVGEKLLKANYPAIHAVGKGSECEPRLIELEWGDKQSPLIVLVGKGVCFDSGGLNIKSAPGMRQMKKDMGGAAHALALAKIIMAERLPVRLKVYIPAVENSVDGRSYRPGDVIKTRAGIQVEIDNTDAEGRMVLCDALAAGVEDQPDLMIDFSTLTGAARVALGPDLPAFFCNDDAVANAVLACAKEAKDPLWRLPLYDPYFKYLKSDVADCVNSASTGFAGAITAALYLKQFVPDTIHWMHFDLGAWNSEARPGRPKGADIFALRAVYLFLQQRYGA